MFAGCARAELVALGLAGGMLISFAQGQEPVAARGPSLVVGDALRLIGAVFPTMSAA